MAPTYQSHAILSRGRHFSDGAELPLLDPRLLVTLTSGTDQRRARSAASDCLILTDCDLSDFDPQRVREVRAALGGIGGVRGLGRTHEQRTVQRRTPRWIRALVLATAYVTFAFGLGLVSAFLL